METFEITIHPETFRITRNSPESHTFSVFNHATCHIIHKDNSGKWIAIEHRFGTDAFPLQEMGEAIDRHYHSGPGIGPLAHVVNVPVYKATLRAEE